MTVKSGADTLAQQATFVFKGTVLNLKRATMRGIPVTDRTVTVRVDEVIQAPDVLSEYAGQEITVQLGGRKKVTKGQQSVFYTNGLMFGESAAVQSIDHHEPGEIYAVGAPDAGNPVRRLAQRLIRARVDSADVVVSGRVVSVRIPADVVAARSYAGTESTTLHVSEHDPDWRIAEVQVEQVHKGHHPGRSAHVRFPGSDDVMWHHAPKLHAGHEGLFILHKTEREEAATRAAPSEDGGDYVALHQSDFQPADQLGDLKDMLTSLSQTEASLVGN